MADETPKPASAPGGEEKSPVFQTGMGAFDRAGFNKTFAETKGAGVKEEDIEKSKTADKVFNEAAKYYDQKYRDTIKKLDPEFSEFSVWASVPELTYNSNRRHIKKDIDEGKPLDGVKDILPLAENAAKNKISLVNKLKTGTVTTISEYVGLKDIKDMDSYEAVAEEFDKSTVGENNKLEKLLDNFWKKYLRVFNSDEADASSLQKLYTPENNAVISALAKILEKEGFSSESVKNMSKMFEENLKKFSEKLTGKIEGAETTPGATGATGATGAMTTTEPVKVEEKTQPKESAGATGPMATATTEPAKVETKIESAKETPGATGAAAASSEPAKTEEKLETKEISETATPTPTPATATTEPVKVEEKMEAKPPAEAGETNAAPTSIESNVSEKEKTEKQKSAVSFLTDIFGSSITGVEKKKEEVKKEGGAETGKAEESATKIETSGAETSSGPTSIKSTESLSESTVKPMDKAGSLATTPSSIMASTAKTGVTAAPSLATAKEPLQEKISKKSETISGPGGIKETTPQKLASVSTPASPAESKPAETGTAPGPGAETSIESGKEGEIKSEEASAETPSAAKEEKGTMEDKMEMMISLLSQMNETLQGPLLTINSSKKYE